VPGKPNFKLRAPLVLLATVISLLFSQPASGTSGIKIDARPGVSSTHFKHITIAINNITRFFSDNYKLALQKKMRIIIVPDDQTFAKVLVSDFGYAPAVAHKEAPILGGKALDAKGEYLLVIKAKASHAMPWIIEVACHEIVHWYQYQVAGSKKTGEVKWLAEGCATVIAYQIVGTVTDKTMDQYHREKLNTLRKAAAIPTLRELYSRRDWAAAMDKYGGGAVYSKATAAVLELGQRQGVNSLFYYFINLQKVPPAQAFEQAFGLNMHQFENDMDQKLGKS